MSLLDKYYVQDESDEDDDMHDEVSHQTADLTLCVPLAEQSTMIAEDSVSN